MYPQNTQIWLTRPMVYSKINTFWPNLLAETLFLAIKKIYEEYEYKK